MFYLLLLENGAAVQEALMSKTGQKTVPNVFVSGKHVGGASDTESALKDGRLAQLLAGNTAEYDYDLFVVGGGSGGLACAKVCLLVLLYGGMANQNHKDCLVITDPGYFFPL